MKGRKFFVVEARRLLPLLFLLVLLIGLSVYDNFFKAAPVTVTPVEEEEGSLHFTTTDWGELLPDTYFEVVTSHDEWHRLAEELNLPLPDYPFNAEVEMAVFAVNSEIDNISLEESQEGDEVRVSVTPRQNYYHVITVDRDAVEAEENYWVFVDQQDRVLSHQVPVIAEEEKEVEEESGEEENLEP